ncbi:MAG: hypothetical protein EAZ76_09320 [Nostocales cyanobacterium]|nr:MAG: hypothetical protein EAZ87_16650 [Nostocales cyanobacterium]TAF14745.1 MAG: hypothetical protein EAZ76_09320 [Nostocales cyanobacterium]
MKSHLLLTLTIFLGTCNFSSSVFAGEGGIAAAAAFELMNGMVSAASVSVAVGKSTAYSGAETITGTSAFSVGTGGLINFTGNSLYIESVTAENTHSLNTTQANQLNINVVNIDAINGEVNIQGN